MSRLARFLFAAALLAFLAAGQALAQSAVPALTGRVTDTTGTLSAQQVAGLDQRLAEFESRKGVQFAVLVVATTQPEAIEQYALRVVEQWKLGRRKVDDGALLLVAKNDRALRIEVGYGLEGTLSDIVSQRIIRELITPRFAAGDFAGGIEAGLAAMMKVVEGEALPAPKAKPGDPSADVASYLPVLLVVGAIGGALLRPLLGRVGGSVAAGGLVTVAAWLLVGIVSTALFAGILATLFVLAGGPGLLMAGRHHGGWGGHGRGGGGGGFRGGGGGFGGGGSSGRW